MKEYTELDVLKKLIRKSKGNIYIVGGTVRDFLLKRKTHDIDIVTEEDPENLIEDLPFFPLDEERKIFRCVYPHLAIDIAKIQGESIEEDLRRRDFTVNAIAYDVRKERFIDPLNGIDDLKKGILKAVSLENLQEDPVRLIRAVRLWLYYPFKLFIETKKAISQFSYLIKKIPGERIKEELFKIISYPLSYKAIKLLYELNLLENIIPELSQCKGLFQGKFCGSDLLGHLLCTYKASETIIHFLGYLFNEYPQMREIMETETEAGIKIETILKLSALLHDIAKPQTFTIREDEYTFWGHDKEGAKKTQIIAKRLKLSNKSSKVLKILVENHMRLHLLARTGEITDKAKGRFFRQLKETGVIAVILSLSDSLASSGDLGFFYLLPFAREMVDFYFNKFLKKENLQKPLLSGYDIMDILNIKPGPKVGKIIKALLDAQAEGKIKTKEEAISFIKEEFGHGKGGNTIH